MTNPPIEWAKEVMLTTEEAAAIVGVRPSSLSTWRYRSTGPRAFKVGGQWRYRESDLHTWMQSQYDNNSTHPEIS